MIQLGAGQVSLAGTSRPKTIANDLYGTAVTFGLDTACTTATEALDKLITIVVGGMGRYRLDRALRR